MSQNNKNRTVVVGIDGSPSSIDALGWAVRDAEVGDSTLTVAMAWRAEPSMAVKTGANSNWVPMTSPEYEDTAQQSINSIVAEHVPDEFSGKVTTVVREGAASQVLVELATELHASALVVGSRGLGGVTGMMLGSVSDYCIRNAPCTVVVVRHQK